MKGLRLDIWSLVLLLAVAIIAFLLVWPLWGVFAASFIHNRTGEPTLANYARALGHPFYLQALGNSLIVGFGGMLGAVLLGLPVAVLTTRYRIRGRDFLATLAVLALDRSVKLARQAQVKATAQVLHNGLAVLGVSAPQKM